MSLMKVLLTHLRTCVPSISSEEGMKYKSALLIYVLIKIRNPKK